MLTLCRWLYTRTLQCSMTNNFIFVIFSFYFFKLWWICDISNVKIWNVSRLIYELTGTFEPLCFPILKLTTKNRCGVVCPSMVIFCTRGLIRPGPTVQSRFRTTLQTPNPEAGIEPAIFWTEDQSASILSQQSAHKIGMSPSTMSYTVT